MFKKINSAFISYLCIAFVFTLFGYYLRALIHVENVQPSTHAVLTQTCSNEHESISVASKFSKNTLLAPYKKHIIEHTINNTDDNDLAEKLSALFPNSHIDENIHDIRKFSHRLIEEISDNDTANHIDSLATISFSLSRKTPDVEAYSFDVSDKQTIFAHINVNGGLGMNNKQFFIKWRNMDTNEILLYTPKSMNANSEQNWVSLTPEVPWGNQNYEVSFYEYTSELNKLASATYITLSQ